MDLRGAHGDSENGFAFVPRHAEDEKIGWYLKLLDQEPRRSSSFRSLGKLFCFKSDAKSHEM